MFLTASSHSDDVLPREQFKMLKVFSYTGLLFVTSHFPLYSNRLIFSFSFLSPLLTAKTLFCRHEYPVPVRYLCIAPTIVQILSGLYFFPFYSLLQQSTCIAEVDGPSHWLEYQECSCWSIPFPSNAETKDECPTTGWVVMCKSQKALVWGSIPSTGIFLSCVLEKHYVYTS